MSKSSSRMWILNSCIVVRSLAEFAIKQMKQFNFLCLHKFLTVSRFLQNLETHHSHNDTLLTTIVKQITDKNCSVRCSNKNYMTMAGAKTIFNFTLGWSPIKCQIKVFSSLMIVLHDAFRSFFGSLKWEIFPEYENRRHINSIFNFYGSIIFWIASWMRRVALGE